jgi:tRNA CCA-adding enzyme
MKSKNTTSLLKEVLQQINPPKEQLQEIDSSLKSFLEKLEKKLKSSKIIAQVFVGGSFAKKTLIKKDKYDVDVFLRFDKKYKDKDISIMTKKILKTFVKPQIIHGSRDYYRIKISKAFFIELIPVIKVANPKQSENITDLSYSHVKYIRKNVKNQNILDGIKLAKAFCYAHKCYGAESYINGFSGYSLELLVYYYKGFMNFIKAMAKLKDQVIIDMEKQHKTKQNILMDLNESKLSSPIILIDPTYKQRNVSAALSNETFKKFQKVCEKFVKNPSLKLFEQEKTDLNKIKLNAIKNKSEFLLIEIKTKKQEGDIAGSKLLKFYKHLDQEFSKYFFIKKKGFNYNDEKAARCFFVVKSRKEILFAGPHSDQKKHFKAFKKKHKNAVLRKKRLYAKQKITFNAEQFLTNWQKANKKKIKEMYISGLKNI